MLPALHIPDGFIDVPTSAAVWLVALVGIALALRGARRSLDDSLVPMAGLTAVFIFAMQMLNFPIAAGTSGHLIGAALAAVLIGPWAAVLALTVVLVVQALFFADGGLIALGLNITNLALIAVVVAWLAYVGLTRILPRSPVSVIAASGVAGFISVPVAALAFVVEFAVGGSGAVPLSTVFTAMVGVHLVIGIVEGVVTALVVAAVLALRPDLVYGARGLLASRELVLTPPTAVKEA